MSILIVGTVAFDAIETPFGKTDKIVGGAATYISLAASFFSNKLRLVSVVGDDFPKDSIQMLKDHKVDTSGLQIKEGEKTFFWSGKYHNDMNSRDTVDTQLNVLENFDPILPEDFKDSEFLMLGNLVPSVQQKVLDQMTKRPKLIVLDTMNFWMDNCMSDLKTALKNIDVLTINDEEARQLSEEYSLVKAAKIIQKMGPKYLVIKKGEHGALLFGEEKMFFAPALPLENVFDPTGAGDSFAGGFIGHLQKTGDITFENLKSAVIYGSVMASFCVEKFGTERLSELTNNEVSSRLEEFVKLSSFKI
ncbi:MAG: PfkB family carbohydrate kinase [Flavobacteriales bacterium]|jgi:sugar/nucleoside kinase (ribokinase family)|tara:strand:- start:3630 stop:4544 length:915 start_codon:yes stop_codon:yes gene_type:complete